MSRWILGELDSPRTPEVFIIFDGPQSPLFSSDDPHTRLDCVGDIFGDIDGVKLPVGEVLDGPFEIDLFDSPL